MLTEAGRLSAAGAEAARITRGGRSRRVESGSVGAGFLKLPDGSPVMPHVPEPYQTEAKAVRAVRDVLAASPLDWTCFAPAAVIAPGERTGVFRVGRDTLISDAAGESRISVEDDAVAMLEELERPEHGRSMMTVGC